MEFFEGTRTVGLVTSEPYEVTVSGLTNVGSHVFSARIVDAAGTNQSLAVTIEGMAVRGLTASRVLESSARLNGALEGIGSAAVTFYWGERGRGVQPDGMGAR